MPELNETDTETTAPIELSLPEKHAQVAEWRAANPEPHTDEQKQAHIALLEKLYGEFDGLVVELKAALGGAPAGQAATEQEADTATG